MALTHPISDLPTDGFTVADLDAMPDDGRRYELIGGSIVMTPPPAISHQRSSTRLLMALTSAFGPEFELFSGPIGLSLPTGDEVEPDLVVVEAGRTGKRLTPPVALIVELISPGSARHDSVTKLDAYARASIDHYWLVDTRDGQHSFRALRLNDSGNYELVADSDDAIRVTEPVELHMTLEDLSSSRRLD